MVSSDDEALIRRCSRDDAAFAALLALFEARAGSHADDAHAALDMARLLEQSSDVFVAYDPDLRYVAINQLGARMLNRTPPEVIGRTNAELIGPGAATIDPYVRECFTRGQKVFTLHEIPTASGVLMYDSVYTPVLDEEGRTRRVVGVCRDVTADKQRMRQLERRLLEQEGLLQEMSTPLMHIRPGVVLMPLVGAIDDRRARQMTEVLLRGLTDSRAHTAILDITGVTNLDGRVASALLTGAKAARLLGAHVLLTGISPEVARTLVELAVDLAELATFGSLQQGFAFATERPAMAAPGRA